MTQQRTIFVTGGSSGLGAACTQSLLSRGDRVIVLDLTPPLDELTQSPNMLYQKADITSEEEVQNAIAHGIAKWGSLNGAVLCAGIIDGAKLLGRSGPASLDRFRRVIEVNLTGTFNCVRLAADAMTKTPADEDGQRGVIVLTSSIAASEGQIGQLAYSASKGGVASLTLPLARELANHGIRVVSIAPGIFETPMMEKVPPKIRQSLIDQTPFPHRLGHPHEFSSLVNHIFDNKMINGCVVRLDAGIRMGRD